MGDLCKRNTPTYRFYYIKPNGARVYAKDFGQAYTTKPEEAVTFQTTNPWKSAQRLEFNVNTYLRSTKKEDRFEEFEDVESGDLMVHFEAIERKGFQKSGSYTPKILESV